MLAVRGYKIIISWLLLLGLFLSGNQALLCAASAAAPQAIPTCCGEDCQCATDGVGAKGCCEQPDAQQPTLTPSLDMATPAAAAMPVLPLFTADAPVIHSHVFCVSSLAGTDPQAALHVFRI